MFEQMAAWFGCGEWRICHPPTIFSCIVLSRGSVEKKTMVCLFSFLLQYHLLYVPLPGLKSPPHSRVLFDCLSKDRCACGFPAASYPVIRDWNKDSTLLISQVPDLWMNLCALKRETNFLKDLNNYLRGGNTALKNVSNPTLFIIAL